RVGRRAGGALAERAADRHDVVVIVARRRRLVYREAHVAVRRARDRHTRFVGGSERQHLLRDRLTLFTREQRDRWREQRTRRAGFMNLGHAVLPVLMTLMLRKRDGTQPCETALLCGGCPLPSPFAPPRK